MQFRERAKVIQVIRTVYDPRIKRGRAELVGRLDRDSPTLSDELRLACSPGEIAEIEEYLAARAQSQSAEVTREAAETLAARMRLAEAYFRAGADQAAGSVAAEILTAWEDLKKALHKAGYRKDKPEHGHDKGRVK